MSDYSRKELIDRSGELLDKLKKCKSELNSIVAVAHRNYLDVYGIECARNAVKSLNDTIYETDKMRRRL